MSTTKTTLKIYWHHTRPYKVELLKIYPMIIAAIVCESFIAPLIIAKILNEMAAGIALQWETVLPMLFWVVLLFLVSHTLWNILVRIFWRTQDNIMRDLNLSVFKHLSSMSYRFYSDRFAGSLVNQTNKFVGSFERLTDPLTWTVFNLLVALVATSVILWSRAPLVVLMILLITAIYAPVVWIFRRRQVPYNRRWAAAETKRTGQLADSVTNILAVKSFANEKLEYHRMQDRANEVHDRSMDTMRINMRQELVSGYIQRSISISVIIISVLLAKGGHIEVGLIYLSLTYTTSIMGKLWELNNAFRQFTRVFGDSSDMAKIMELEPEVKDSAIPEPFHVGRGKVELKQVGFWYPKSKDQLFNQFDLKIKPGEKIGLVGPSGGGKTTITKLLLRFMDIQEGQILLDDQDIAKVKQSSLREAITYVPQEPLLFHRSLSENIGYGNPKASQAAIVKAAKAAHADEFVRQLPEGYDTLVGERGVKLSGGQKQRVAIARALIKDAPIVVLDEATSALDSESEALIQEALWELMKDKTAIVIAHRLSTIKKLDRIIVLDDGKIVEEGTHEQLHKKTGGLYARLWNHQSGGFITE